MINDQRPDPDALLAAVQTEEAQQQHGKLKIFLGMSAGVGKTYAMLESAHQRLAEGIDVVIGYIETHKRADTDALVAGLPLIARQKIDYKESTLEEMDVDAILRRRPRLVLVDELAHTNAPGSRHPKRYQDVLELLASGIDVYTTVNVQHFESRSDTVEKITGITIHEKVPDSILDIASDIELIDLPPEELLQRLAEGKVYAPDRAELAAKNFFRTGNLTALREMALRLAAERVDQQMQDYMQVQHIQGPWRSTERLMVAVSPSPLSERLIRWTRRTAYNLKAPWMAVYIEPTIPLSQTAHAQLARNLSLVHKLGGEVVSTAANDVVTALIRVAKQHNITQIVVGKPSRTFVEELRAGGSLVNRLIRQSDDIDIYVVRGDVSEGGERPLVVRPALHSGRNQYLLALFVVAAAVAFCLAILPFIDHQLVALLLLFVVVVLANFVGRGPILVAAAASALLWDFLFIPPRLTFFISTLQDALTFFLYFIVALITGNLTARLRSQEKLTRGREERTAALYTMAHKIGESTTLDEVLETAVKQLGQVFAAPIAILLKDADGDLPPAPHALSTFAMNDREMGAARWSFNNSQPAGHFTETLPTADAQYWPMTTPGGVAGVIGLELHEQLSFEQEGLLQTFTNHIALAVEREQLDESAQQAAIVAESERLYATLLDSISHELRTPLAVISGATGILFDPVTKPSPAAQQELGENIQEATKRLTRLVNNLLDMTRLQSGRFKPHVEWCDVTDLIDVSVKQVEKDLAAHDLVIDIAPQLPLVRMDFVLMEQVLVNLLDNAAVHTPPGVRVRVTAALEHDELMLSVADRGPGLPPGDLQRVFEKFYRAPGTASGGTGLGLSICKGLVEAQGGTITAENRLTRGGARLVIRLPITPAPTIPKEAEQ